MKQQRNFYKKVVWPPLIILSITLILGVGSHLIFHPHYHLLVKYQPPEDELLDFEEIDIYFLLDIMENNMGILVDARDQQSYTESHIPGALNLPVYQFDQHIAMFTNQTAKDRIIITYCIDLNCTDSKLLANKLYEAGYKNLFIYKEGMEGWRQYQDSIDE